MPPSPAGQPLRPLSLDRLKSALQTQWLGRNLVYKTVVDSTMNVARSLALAGAADGSVVIAEEQLEGRGRRGRSWLSPRFANLYLSVLFYPTLDQLRSLPLIAPLAILDALNAACNVRCSLKWPNDVLAADKKIAGVLLESELRGDSPQFAIVGLGINVNFDPGDYPEIAALATSALHEAGVLQNREALLASCLAFLEQWYQSPGEQTLGCWKSLLSTLGRRVTVSLEGRKLDGVADDVADDGSLILLRDDGSRVTLASGEVTLSSYSP